MKYCRVGESAVVRCLRPAHSAIESAPTPTVPRSSHKASKQSVIHLYLVTYLCRTLSARQFALSNCLFIWLSSASLFNCPSPINLRSSGYRKIENFPRHIDSFVKTDQTYKSCSRMANHGKQTTHYSRHTQLDFFSCAFTFIDRPIQIPLT